MTRPYLDREDTGNLVYELLTRSDPTIDEACDELGLTKPQFRYGLTYIKDILAEVSSTPIVCDPTTHRYSLALQEDEVMRYEKMRLKTAVKQLERLRTGTAIPAAALFGESITSRRFVRYLEGAQEELSLLLASLEDA